jgi:hypothetical protein
MSGLDNFDRLRAREAREEAIDSIEAHARQEWKRAALNAVFDVAATHDEFTTDVVWRLLLTQHPDLRVHDNRAMGPVMREAARLGVVERTGRYEDSERVSCHSRSLMLWRSCVR